MDNRRLVLAASNFEGLEAGIFTGFVDTRLRGLEVLEVQGGVVRPPFGGAPACPPAITKSESRLAQLASCRLQ